VSFREDDGAGQLRVGAGDDTVGERFGVSGDGRQRGTQLVRHGGEETVFGLGGSLEFNVFVIKSLLCSLPLGKQRRLKLNLPLAFDGGRPLNRLMASDQAAKFQTDRDEQADRHQHVKGKRKLGLPLKTHPDVVKRPTRDQQDQHHNGSCADRHGPSRPVK